MTESSVGLFKDRSQSCKFKARSDSHKAVVNNIQDIWVNSIKNHFYKLGRKSIMGQGGGR